MNVLTQQHTEEDAREQIGCRECGTSVAAQTGWCSGHLLGRTVSVAYDRRFPRLKLADGRRLAAGGDAWLPWLREANVEDLQMVLKALEGRRA